MESDLIDPIPIETEAIAEAVLDSAFAVHRALGPGLLVELKAVEKHLPLYEAQLLTCLKLTGHRIGLLINFNVPLLKDGIERVVL